MSNDLFTTAILGVIELGLAVAVVLGITTRMIILGALANSVGRRVGSIIMASLRPSRQGEELPACLRYCQTIPQRHSVIPNVVSVHVRVWCGCGGESPDEREHRERAGHGKREGPTMMATMDDEGRIVDCRIARTG